MNKIGAILMVCLVFLASSRGDNPPAVALTDFKLVVTEFGIRNNPVSTEEIIVHRGRAYNFPTPSKEVTIIDPARKTLEIVDVGRRLQTEISFRSLEASLEKIKGTLREAAEKREKQGGRGNIVEAKMTRDLFETKLVATSNSKSHRIRLTNPSIEVDADGEVESDGPRLALIAAMLESIAKLGAFRAPSDLPPFAELEAIDSLIANRLRPISITYLYRLAGPPRKFRRTYQFVPTLTEREIQAITRVDRFREAIQTVRYEQFRQDR